MNDTASGLEIVAPAPRRPFITLYLGFQLCAYLLGGLLLAVFLRSVGFGALMSTYFLLLWMLGLGVAIYQFSWFLVGRERIVLSPSRLSIKRELFGMGRIREYDKEHMHDLRVSPMPYKRPFGFRASLHDRVVGGGVIAFDYGPTTVRFGAGLEEAEAKSVLVHIKSRGFGA